jgi:hypothetical protein
MCNTETKAPDLRDSYLSKYNIGGNLNEFPYNDEKEIFNINEIIEALKK